MRLITLLIGSILFLTSCATQKSLTKFQPAFDFSTVKTYSLYDRNSAFGELQNLNDTMRNSIELLIERNLDKQGYQYQTIENSDIIVSYLVVSRSSAELKLYNRGTKYCSTCLKFAKSNENHSEMSQQQTRRGNLVIDLIDPKNKRSIWRSSYALDIEVKDNSVVVQEKLLQAINAMLTEIPRS